jgi:hypothetical protein
MKRYNIFLFLLIVFSLIAITHAETDIINEYEYIVYYENNTYYAENQITGIIDYQGTNKYSTVGKAVQNTDNGFILCIGFRLYPQWIEPYFDNDRVTIVNYHDGIIRYFSLYGHRNGSDNVTTDKPVMIFQALTNTSKPILEWRLANDTAVAWLVAHEYLHENGVYKPHKHISIETSDSSMKRIITRFEVGYGKDIADVRVSNADFYVMRSGLKFYQDNNRDTYIYSRGENDVSIKTNNKDRININGDGIKVNMRLYPAIDGYYSLGSETNRFRTVNAMTGNFYGIVNFPIKQQNSNLQVGSTYYNVTYNVLVSWDGAQWRYSGNGSIFPN